MIPFRNHHKPKYFSVVTIGIILINIWVFWHQMTGPDLREFIMNWALVPALLDTNDPATWVTLVTAQFLHAGILHIGFNMWFLWIFGRNIESRFGHIRFLVFYLLSGIVAALAQLFLIVDPTIPMLGASGAVAGVLGAYLVLFSHHRIDVLVPFILWVPLALPANLVLFLWFIGQFFSGVAALAQDVAPSGVAWWAHIGGFVFGVIVAAIFYLGREEKNQNVKNRDNPFL